MLLEELTLHMLSSYVIDENFHFINLKHVRISFHMDIPYSRIVYFRVNLSKCFKGFYLLGYPTYFIMHVLMCLYMFLLEETLHIPQLVITYMHTSSYHILHIIAYTFMFIG